MENKDGMPPYAIQLKRMEIHVDVIETNMNALRGHIKTLEIERASWKDRAERLMAVVE
jgi:hypothetical protein